MEQQKCKFFGECGGCDLQHLSESEYYSFKQNIAEQVSDKLNYSNENIAPVKKIGWNGRRRVKFRISKNKGDIKLGFFKRKSHEVVDIDGCPLLCTQINNHINDFKELTLSLKKSGLVTSLSVALSNNYLDVIIATKNDLPQKDQNKIIEYCKTSPQIQRVSLTSDTIDKIDNKDYNTIYNASPFIVSFANIDVKLPINAFLQATSKAQDSITEIILDNISYKDKVIDLFCGCGAYSFPLLKKAAIVKAFEGSYEMVMAANKAAVKYQIESKISFENRDLFKKPVKSDYLKPYKVAVINPPRAGACNQIKEMVLSNIEKIIMVSCNPTTFQRDAEILVSNGYSMKQLHPVDQFYQTKHLELVGIFKKNTYS